MKTTTEIKKGRRIIIMYAGICLIAIFCQSYAMLQDEPEGPWVAPASADKLINPLKADATIMADGKEIYKEVCEQCHGPKGDGVGWQSLNVAKKIAPIYSPEIQKQSDGALFWKITNGNKPMPSMRKALNDNQRWMLVLYVRELGKSYGK